MSKQQQLLMRRNSARGISSHVDYLTIGQKERKEGKNAFWDVWGGEKNRLDVYSVTLHLEESNKKFKSIERESESRRKIAVKKYNPLFFLTEKKTYESLMQFNIFS